MLFAVLAVWALVATGLFAWQTWAPPSASTLWDSDASLLQEFQFQSSNVAFSLGWFGPTTWSMGQEAVSWIDELIGTLDRGRSAPGGFASAGPLNLTEMNLVCSLSGMTYVAGLIRDIPSAWNGTIHASTLTYGGYALRTWWVYTNVSRDLSGVRPLGTDPLLQIGPAGVSDLRTQLGQLRSLTLPLGTALNCT